MVDQATPQGNLTYTQNGTRSYTTTDAAGKPVTYTVPSYLATQTYTPAEQKLFDTNNATKQQVSQIGLDQSHKMGDLLNTPINLDDTSIDDHLYSLYSPRVTQQQTQAGNALDAKLAAQGVTQGSEAWNNAQRQLSNANTDQWNQLYLGGHQQAIQQMVQQRQEPINELDALMSGSQVSNPTYGQTPSTTISPANYEGDVYNSYNAAMQGYNAQLQSNNAMMGGIFGTLGAIGGGWAMSDRRLKADIVRLGALPNGLPVYSFRFKSGGPPQIGLMADEVALVHPHAVTRLGGYDAVNYVEAVR